MLQAWCLQISRVPALYPFMPGLLGLSQPVLKLLPQGLMHGVFSPKDILSGF